MADAPAALGSLAGNPELDQWLALRDGRVVVRTGKAELGQGIYTAVAAVAADELGVDLALIDVEGPATGSSPNELLTAGSGSIEQSATAVRQACAHARRALLARAVDHFGVPADELVSGDGLVRTTDGREVSYWELVGDAGFGVTITEAAPTVAPDERRHAGAGVHRLDLPAKTRGEPAFVHDVGARGTPARVRHARVVRPGWIEHALAEPADPDALVAAARDDLGVDVDVVVDGSFVAIVAEREGDAVLAASVVADRLRWRDPPAPPSAGADPDQMVAAVQSSHHVVDGTALDEPPPPPLGHDGAATVVEARYSKPFLLHGSIGPSAAVARFDGARLEVWSHSQGVEMLRPCIADALGMDADAVVVRHVDGAGCYGHNGADDAGFDAALVAFHRPGAPVKVQWSRADEHRLEPASPAMTVTLSAGLDAHGELVDWNHDTSSYAHVGRPFPAGPERSGLLAAWSRATPALRPPPRGGAGGFHGGPHRNADPLYDVGARRVASHFVAPSPIRTSSTRSLGAFANVFAIESFMDELAHAAGTAPDRFRVAHLTDPRAVEVIDAVVELAGGLSAPGGVDAPGRGLAFARYENIKAYVAVVVEAAVDARTGRITLRRAWIAADAGEVIDPGGLANQLEGGFVQAASWTLHEELPVDAGRVTVTDWEDYPIMRFSEVPVIETRLLARPEEPVLGAAEAVTGPTPAAIANAVFDATGARLRDLPLRPARVRTALDALVG
ncbi:MAG TPA: molybdopterin cofactor-binding domain-containing protein [Acidimicrobiia bacterium]